MFKPEHDTIQKAANKYRLLMIAIFLFYITDALWGIFAGLNWIPALFVDTTIYYVAMALAITWFYQYIVEYLEIKGEGKNHHLAIFFFSLSMLIAIIFQERYPLLPFYALGCLIGSCILHVYVVGDESSAYQKMLVQEKEKLQISAYQFSNYKRAFLSDALISLEVNLTKDELYYGVWKNEEGKELPLKDIIELEVPCSYDTYIKKWNSKFTKDTDVNTFSIQSDRQFLLNEFKQGKTEITFDYESKTVSGKSTWLRRNIAMIQNQAGDVIAFTNVKDISAQITQAKREEAYVRALATEYDSIAIVQTDNVDKSKDKVTLHSRLSDDLNALIDEETANEIYYHFQEQKVQQKVVL